MLLVPKWPGPTEFRDHQGLRDSVASASSPRPFPPNQACLGQGEAQQCTVIPTVTQSWASSSSTTPVPFPRPLGLPASRLQDSGLLKTEKLTSQHVYNFDFVNTALCCSPVLPASTHVSSLIPQSRPVSCPASGPLTVLGPLPQNCSSHGLPPRSPPISGRWFGGSFWAISHFCPGISKPLSYLLTPYSRDCYFRIILLSKAKPFCLSGTVICPVCSATHTCHQERHRCRTPLRRDPAKELPPGVMKAMTDSPGNSSWTQGTWVLLCMHPQGHLVNSTKLGAARQTSLEYPERRASGSRQPRWSPLDLTLAAAVPCLRTSQKTFPGLRPPQHPCL
ncbi:hypothetical protein HJG60_010803 [Phyllostomus discolor]|uniref:Uncharacterized protein n=1 Tax=Phyllostomus discolor TaxID=89673 RepID=A0A834ABW9_9CHIR|nr:hypothetical protein HJG60_010803 [Phyllostomus discolor]